MKLLCCLTFLGLLLQQTQTAPSNPSGLEVTQLKFKTRKVEDVVSGGLVSTDPPVLNSSTVLLPEKVPANTDPKGRDRMLNQQVDKITRNTMKEPNPRLAGNRIVYDFEATMKNTTSKPIIEFVWAYQLPASSPNPEDIAQEQYLCRVKIEPGQTRQVKVVSPIPRSRVVDATTAGTPPAPHKPTPQDMIINLVKFADLEKWQRVDWNPLILTRQGARKLDKGRCIAL
jgi:hypothetical protein